MKSMIDEINAQYAERVKLLERERDAKVAMVRGRCAHEGTVFREPLETLDFLYREIAKCKHCGAPMP